MRERGPGDPVRARRRAERPARRRVGRGRARRRARAPGSTHVERADVAAKLREWDLFVLASRRDPFPLSSLEAMAAGLPVIGTRVDGIARAGLRRDRRPGRARGPGRPRGGDPRAGEPAGGGARGARRGGQAAGRARVHDRAPGLRARRGIPRGAWGGGRERAAAGAGRRLPDLLPWRRAHLRRRWRPPGREAPIYTIAYRAGATDDRFAGRDVRTSYLQRIGLSRRWYRYALPLLPARRRVAPGRRAPDAGLSRASASPTASTRIPARSTSATATARSG